MTFSADSINCKVQFCAVLLSPLTQGRELKFWKFRPASGCIMSPLTQGRALKYLPILCGSQETPFVPTEGNCRDSPAPRCGGDGLLEASHPSPPKQKSPAGIRRDFCFGTSQHYRCQCFLLKMKVSCVNKNNKNGLCLIPYSVKVLILKQFWIL